MKAGMRERFFKPVFRIVMSYIIGSANIRSLANLPKPHLFNAISILFEIIINTRSALQCTLGVV